MDELEKLKSALAKVKPADVHCEGEEPATIDITDTLDISGSEYSIDLNTLNSGILGGYSYANVPSYGNVTISNGGSSGSMLTSNGFNGSTWNTNITTSPTPSLHVSGDTEFEGDIKWKGRSLGTLLQSIEDRLAILQEPSSEKLEKYAALKKAYDHYKLLEKLIGEE
jgi:hypothetical protein